MFRTSAHARRPSIEGRHWRLLLQVKSLAGNAMHAISIGSIIAFTMARTRLLPALRVMRGISSSGDFGLGFSGGSECDFDEDGLMSILSCDLVDETSRSGMTSRTSAGSVGCKRMGDQRCVRCALNLEMSVRLNICVEPSR